MFNIFKKNSNSSVEINKDEGITPSIEELLSQANQFTQRIKNATGTAKADLLDEQGSLFARAGEVDKAISAFEASLKEANRMGTAYKELTKLYNKKRAEAAAAGNDADIKKWLDKIQGLMQSSKDMLRGK